MLMTVNSTNACRPLAMPQDQRRRSCDEYDVISSDFPPPSLKPTNSPDQDKRKKKKWSLGGLFRRKKKESDTDSSSPLEEEEKKGFLDKRRARKRRNRGSKDVTGSFEHVIINHRQSQVLDSTTESRDVSNGRVARSHETLVKREPNHIRGSSVSLEGAGRKGGRLQVKARVEENRERLRGESSSDEGGGSSKHSSSSFQRSKADENVSKDGSLSRRSRAARTERYKKRLSKDDESLRDFHVPSRISRSDERLSNKKAERPMSANRWTAKVVYYESSDYDTKYTAITKSATPSPIQSPKARPKNALHYTASAPAASNYVTYPPSHAREGVAGSFQELRSQRSVDRVPLNQRHPDVAPPRLPKSNSEMIPKTAQLPNSIQRHYPSWGKDALNRKSASYDCNVNNIHYVNNQISQPHPTDENVLVVQFPLSRPAQKAENKVKMGLHSLQISGKQQNPPPPPPRDPHRRLVPGNGYHHESSPRPMSYAFEDKSPMQPKYPGYHEFGSTSSAFQRVPQTLSGPIEFDPVKSMNRHQRSSSDNHIPRMGVKQSPPMSRKMFHLENDQIGCQGSHNSYASSPPSDHMQTAVPCHYQYYTDLQPRSRKPIHIAYQNQKPQNDPYLSDSQVIVKPPVQQTPRSRPSGVQNAADFWKQKDQESAKKVHLSEGSPKLIQRHLLNLPAGDEKSRSNSPLKDGNVSKVKQKVKLPPLIIPVKGMDALTPLNKSNHRESLSPRTPNCKKPDHNEIGIPVFEGVDLNNSMNRPLSMLVEKQETSEQEVSPVREKQNNPPTPPQRRDSKVNAVTSFEHFEVFSDNENKDGRRKSSNLEEALNELEAIYKSLRLGEDNYIEKVAKEQSVYENNRLDPSNWNAWVQSRGFESDSSFNYSRSSLESVDSVDSPIRSSNSRRSGVPDRVTDDMAYRRLNKKDRPSPQEQEVLSQAGSFLLVSPTLSPPPLIDPPLVTYITKEPDVEKDDVVYRSIKHVNNTLKCLDPQPPFGIPLGPITPAPNSDYLHVSHKENFRPSFKPRKIPDVVTDDLAFRNLRKDSNKEPLFTAEDGTFLDSPTMKKKKAVRSLSANLLGIIQRESAMKTNNNKLIYNNNTVQGELEKSHSFTDVHGALNVNGRSTNGYQRIRDTSSKKNLSGEDSDVTPRVSRVFSTGTSSPLTATSTETLTGSKNSLWAPESKTGNSKLSKSPSPKFSLTPERRHTTDNVNFHPHKPTSPSKYIPVKAELSKHSFSASYPKSNFLSTTPDSHMFSYENAKTIEATPPSYDQKESDLLAILAREAKEASEQLSKELNELNFENSLQPTANNLPTALEINKDQSDKKVPAISLDTKAKQPISKSLTIGKIIPHKPVKLNTYIITEDDKLESKQTFLTNNPSDIEGSKSMTDLLKELTRSLDMDFGSYPKDTVNQVTISKIEEKANEKEESRQNSIETNYDETYINEEEDVTNLKECEEKYFSSHEDVSDERFSSPEKFLQSFVTEAIENQKEQIEQKNKQLSTSSQTDILEEQTENQKLIIIEDVQQSPPQVNTEQNKTNDNSVSHALLEENEKQNEESDIVIKFSPENNSEKNNETYSLITEQDTTEVEEVLNALNEECSQHSEETLQTSSPLPKRFPLVLPQDELIENKSSKCEVTSHSSNDSDTPVILGVAGATNESSPPGPSGESKLVPRDCIDCPRMTDEDSEVEICPPSTMVALLDTAESSERERMEGDAAARQQRISRYKEQRRRQLAAQYGSHDVGTVSTPASGGGITIRSTRASRLRSAAAATTTANGNSSDSPGNKGPEAIKRPSTSERKEVNGKLGPSPQDKEKSPLLSDNSLSSGPRRERDKSAKRKSNLNRSLNAEPVQEDAGRRRRSMVLSSPSPRSPPVTATPTAPASAPETDSPRHIPVRTYKRTTPPRDSPRHRPRSSSTILEPVAPESSAVCVTTPPVNGQAASPPVVPEPPPTATPQPLPDVVVLASAPTAPAKPSSILKKKSVDESSSPTAMCAGGKPVSILKRKTSQEEGSCMTTQPVTFSPSVVEPSSSRRQGILKKHRSLDDGGGIMVRRSASPDKPILKHQRRSSLEEVRRRTQSPEPTSILKRKTSRDEVIDSSLACEPQGILKRKTSSSSGPVYVTIADSVILAVAGEDSLTEDHVRPILKKKMSVSEEPSQTQAQDSQTSGSSEAPKPILKKKSSSETEESEEKPKKPILKSRSSSRVSEGRSSFTGLETPMNGIVPSAEIEPSSLSVRSESSSEGPVIRRVVRNDPDIAEKRRSLDSWVRFREDCERINTQSPRVRASWSVAERVLNMESFLANETSQRPRSLSPGVESKGAVPRRMRDGERWRTQPITVQELNGSQSWSREQSDMLSSARERVNGPDMDVSERDVEEEEGGRKLARSNSVSARASMFEALKQQREEPQLKKAPKGSAARRVKLDPARFQTQPVTQDEVEEAKRANEASKSSSAEDEDPNDPSKLSLAERVKLFNEKMVATRFNSRTQRHKTQPITPEEVETAQKLTPMARSASSVLVSGILKNLSEKNLGPKPKDSSDSEEESVKVPSSPLKRGILKSPSRNPKPETVEDSDSSCLKSVLKKENKISEPDRKSKDLHSILKASKECSSSEETESDSEDDKPNANSDLIDLLHKVEAQARGERKANASPERRKSLVINNNKKPDESDKLMNLKNLDQGKENYDVTRRFRRKRENGDFSGDDSSSSGGREVRKIIGNEAVARRRQAGLAREAAERAKRSSVGEGLSKSRSHSAMNGEVVLRPPSGAMEAAPLRRCRTQPMDECDEPLTNGVSIAQRLEALQKRGQTDWKKRVSRLNPGEELPPTISINATAQVLVERVSSPPPAAAPPPVASSLPHTLFLLQEASEGWKQRVSPSDATKFSVAGKMGAQVIPASPLLSPNTERKKVKPERFRSKGPAPKDVQSVPTSPETETSTPSAPPAFKRSVSAPGDDDNSLSSGENEGPLVTVPKAFDEEFSKFFASSAAVTSDRIELRDEDLETVTSSSSQLVVQRRQVKVQRRRMASSNPVKALAARTDLRDTYVEVKSGIASREEQRLRIEKLAKNSSLAVEALAGLASKEDFAGVQLRSTAQTPASVHTGPWLPYTDLMLLQVKGRRHVQTRLVRPHYTSVNQGDSYVLVTPTQVFQWVGEYSNVIERSRSGEIATHVAQTRDLGCSAASVTVVQGSHPNKQFWQLLGTDEDMAAKYKGAEAGHPDEDELYELAVTDTNKIYELEGDELVPREDCWANIPRIEILSHNKVLVFDFGAELYVWMGKSVSLDRRPTVLKLAQELWNHGFNYTECDICPITQAELLGTRKGQDKVAVEKCAAKRPDWCLLAKVTQHMETVLFREKFLDWPDFSRVIQVKKRDKDKQVESTVELKPCDAQEMVDWNPPEPDLQLEGSHLGRGHKYYDAETHRHFEISTLGVTVWHVREFDSIELESESIGHFHSGDSYVVRWHYSVTVTGRELTGQPSRHSTMGRDRVVYWTWQGRDASINDSGAAALLTVQLDKERGPQLTIKQGNEPPAFRRLFNSSMMVHKRRRGDGDGRTGKWRLYVVLGEETAEAMLLEVPLHCRQLRSRGCLILLDTEEGKVYLWRGAHALDHTHKVATTAVEKLKEHLPSEASLDGVNELQVEEICEGKEPKPFFQALGGHNRQLYHSLLSVPAPSEHEAPTTRLFLLTGVSGALTACPAVPACGHTQLPSPFPYTQETLYEARQPALFLVDAGVCVWLWQGWVSEAQADAEVGVRWQCERRAAMATTLQYHKLSHSAAGVTPAPRLVWAGLEPLEFTNLFPTWDCRDDVTEINISDGHAGELVPVEAELERLTQSTFPPSQLLQRPLPDGVDPTRLEDYLAPSHFQEVLGLTKEEFSELPAWKQNKLKQEKGLF